MFQLLNEEDFKFFEQRLNGFNNLLMTYLRAFLRLAE